MKSDLLCKIEAMTEADIYSAVYKDHLTGALNRRAFDECAAAADYVVLADLDSLKYINDTAGHRAGDAYIKELHDVLAFAFGDDNVYRLGGDEFAVLPQCPLEGTLSLMERLQEQFRFFSFGAGEDLPCADNQLSADKLLRGGLGLRAPRGERPTWWSE